MVMLKLRFSSFFGHTFIIIIIIIEEVVICVPEFPS